MLILNYISSSTPLRVLRIPREHPGIPSGLISRKVYPMVESPGNFCSPVLEALSCSYVICRRSPLPGVAGPVVSATPEYGNQSIYSSPLSVDRVLTSKEIVLKPDVGLRLRLVEMMLSLAFVSLFALAQTSVAYTSTSPIPTATPTAGLNLAAKAARKFYFGSATDNPELIDTAYVTILNNTAMFGQLTPANSMKWDAIEPEQNFINFTGGDQIVALAEATGKIVRGHNLVWYSQLPNWVMYGNWTPETLTSVIETHVRTEVSHYTGKISYINIALQTAHAADPNAKLYINDYNLEYTGPKIDAMVQPAEDLLAAGAPISGTVSRANHRVPDCLDKTTAYLQSVGLPPQQVQSHMPIHGIGFESHFILGEISPSELQTNME
ncbi:glycoside hydrolase superfamily [Lanmaoa asiatica]|nr:glycoside hydrolase superfamily [Lanmaoa asiatica]